MLYGRELASPGLEPSDLPIPRLEMFCSVSKKLLRSVSQSSWTSKFRNVPSLNTELTTTRMFLIILITSQEQSLIWFELVNITKITLIHICPQLKMFGSLHPLAHCNVFSIETSQGFFLNKAHCKPCPSLPKQPGVGCIVTTRVGWLSHTRETFTASLHGGRDCGHLAVPPNFSCHASHWLNARGRGKRHIPPSQYSAALRSMHSLESVPDPWSMSFLSDTTLRPTVLTEITQILLFKQVF